jgi:hypothetical protein
LFKISKEVFYTDFFCFFCFDDRGDMDECFRGRGAVVFDFFDCKVGVCGDTDCGIVLCGIDMDYDEDWIGNVITEEFVDGEIGSTKFGTGMVPSDYLLAGYISA